ncbi:MAG TPA: 2-oxoglutarate dehydrogenase E1 component [Alphaproteobacteria bacterium]|nr:2-oxoglutarate dehydrogenase E1 component [Alphaproteobacteria bacterium]
MSNRLEEERLSFLSGANADFIAELYARYLKDPAAIDPSWVGFFKGLADDPASIAGEARGASWAPKPALFAPDGNGATAPSGGNGRGAAAALPPPAAAAGIGVDAIKRAQLDALRAIMLIRAYRVRGHLLAQLDPLGLAVREYHPELDYKTYGFTDADLDRPIFINNVLGLETASLRQIVERVRTTYCGTVGVEYMHIQDPDEKLWIQERIEGHNRTDFTSKGKHAILERLTQAEVFERFLDKKYTGTKRFGLDGAESLIPALEQIIKVGGKLGVEEIIIGMPHRGRLNVLANMMGKPFQAIFSEFEGGSASPDDVQGSGDVKYHLGTSSDREFDGNLVHLSLTANPSHLEAVDPVVLGKTRAKQRLRGDSDRTKVMSLLMHGDAAFVGQGIVAETFELSQLHDYRVGGTIHYIVNNQIGFTTNPTSSRSGPYCSDMGKVVQAPIFHVNGDDPEAVVHVARIATEFRQRFKRDVVIDMFCYRRHGHNEADEPAFTQPIMYRKIAAQPTTRQIYAEKLVRENEIAADEPDKLVADFHGRLEQDFEAAKAYRVNKADWLEGAWSGFDVARGDDRRGETAVELDRLREIGLKLTQYPAGFNINRKVARLLEQKRKMIESGANIDWATGEALAFGSLLLEGAPVRLSGQDSGRGTFSQRHAVLVDQENEDKFIPLANLSPDQGLFRVIDSPLAEASVLGFEYGFSLADPRSLVCWEAQFGDFANGAQAIIDQFISSGEAKWLRMSGLVMLLPHGYEGQGPEHSSARLERYLQLCAEDNMQVVNCTTPSQYFHALRRQIRRNFRKPLIVMTPKSLLRHKLAVSKLADMGPGTSFHRVYYDWAPKVADDKVARIVLCSGKVYYDLFEELERRKLTDVYLLRLEQLYPFPVKSLSSELARFKGAEFVWCQEESKNMGAWTFVKPRLDEVLASVGAVRPSVRYVGRPESAAPATGNHERHVEEQKRLVEEALSI